MSVEAAFNNCINKNRKNNPSNLLLFYNNDDLKEQSNNISILSNPSINYNFSNNSKNGIINNNMNDSLDEQMKPNSLLRNNYFLKILI